VAPILIIRENQLADFVHFMIYGVQGQMATLGMMYPARGGLVCGQMRGCYLKSGVYTP